MSALWTMRHPAPGGPPGLCYGRTCPGLAPGWEAAVTRAARAAPPGLRLISSPAPRCLGPARMLAQALEAPLAVEPRLAEMDFGAWEGRLWSRIDRAESDPWAEDPIRRAPPGGETFGALAARVAEALADVEAASDPAAPALLVTHAGPIRALWMARRGLSFAQAFARPVPFARPAPL